MLGIGKKTRSKVAQMNQQIKSELHRCSVQNCAKFYHFSCAQTNKNFRILDGITQKFRCPLHYCEKCKTKTVEEA